MKSIPKQKCTPEFRLEAVKLVLEQGIQTAGDCQPTCHMNLQAACFNSPI